MKKLTQDTFRIYPSWVRTLVVWSYGDLLGFSCRPSDLYLHNDVMWSVKASCLDKRTAYFMGKFDANDWRDSATERLT